MRGFSPLRVSMAESHTILAGCQPLGAEPEPYVGKKGLLPLVAKKRQEELKNGAGIGRERRVTRGVAMSATAWLAILTWPGRQPHTQSGSRREAGHEKADKAPSR